MPRRKSAPRLKVTNLAQIKEADLTFGDLTVLVGPQATGKSILLQLWKFILDRRSVLATLGENGFAWKDAASFLNLYLGEGMSGAIGRRTAITAMGSAFVLESALRTRFTGNEGAGSLFFIPAHRALTLSEGWPRQFQQYPPDTPFVVRQFSQQIHNLMLRRDYLGRQLRDGLNEAIDDAIFHGAELRLVQQGNRTLIKLEPKKGKRRFSLSYMSWTAGQREFIPLRIALGHLLPSMGKALSAPGIGWVVIEEPEMGLHPQGILAVMLAVLSLLHRGYRVVLSSHSPLVLDVVWALRRFQEVGASPKDVLAMFGGYWSNDLQHISATALAKDYRVYYLDYLPTGAGVCAEDISALDPDSQEEGEAGWGGLTAWSSLIGDAVRSAVNRSER